MIEHKEIQRYLETLAPISAISAVVGFICSAIYNYGYFLNTSVNVSILSFNDLINSMSLWAPLLVSFILGVMISSVIKITAPSDKDHSKKIKPCIKNILMLLQTIIFICIVADLFWYMLFGSSYVSRKITQQYYLFIYVGSIYVWLQMLWFIMKRLHKHINIYNLAFTSLIVIMCAAMFIGGLDTSSKQSQMKSPNISIYMHKSSIPRNFILLRYLEQGLLVKSVKSTNFILITWDEINEIEIMPSKPYKGLLSKFIQ